MNKIKVLLFDIETAPNKVYTWGLYEQDVIKVIRPWYMLTFAYKWLGENKIHSYSLPDFKLFKKDPENDRELCKKLWELFDEADVLIAHNSVAFDVKKSQGKFVQHGFKPPQPFKQVDTLKVARRYFKFDSNRLDYLGKILGVGGKLNTGGFELWEGCMANDKKAWRKMIKYNCLTPDHKVLNKDLRWVEIGSLNIGDKILGFDEKLSDSDGTGRRLRASTVLGNQRIIDDVYEVSLSNGDKIKCTKNHQWLCSPYTSKSIASNPHGIVGGSRWKRTDELIVNGRYLNGNKVTGVGGNSSVVFKYFNVIDELDKKDSGWISGMFDGEGSLSNRKSNAKNKCCGGFQINISQKVGPELEKIKDILTKYNIQYSVNVHRKNYHAEKSKIIKSTKAIGYVAIGGKFYDRIDFLQKFRPERLINNINWENLPRLEGRNKRVIVEEIKHLGKQEIVVLATDTKTYIADGYAMHNCQDVKILEKVYLKLRPWIPNHPNSNVYNGTVDKCPNCGGITQRRGFAITRTKKYQRFQCQSCSAWSQKPLSNNSIVR